MEVLFAVRKDVTGLAPLYTPWDEMVENSGVISLHSPLMPATKNMIAWPQFENMKRKPLLIRCARGGLVGEANLVRALDANLIAGVGFDCLTTEPPLPDNPLLSMLNRPNVIVTTHTD